MSRSPKSRRRWQMAAGALVLLSVFSGGILEALGAGRAALGIGLAAFIPVWPLFFLAVAPVPKPGPDPLFEQFPNVAAWAEEHRPDKKEASGR